MQTEFAKPTFKFKNNREAIFLEKAAITLLLAITFLIAAKQALHFTAFDEQAMLKWVDKIHQHHFPAFPLPPLFFYLQYFLSAVYGFFLALIGVIPTSSGFISTELGIHVTVGAGKIFNAALLTGTVFLVYKIGKSFYNKAVAFSAAASIAVNPILLNYSHTFKPDILVFFLITFSLYFILKFHHTSKLFYILISSFLWGLALAGNFMVFSFLIIIVMAAVMTAKRDIPNHRRKTIIFIPAGALCGFLLGAPNVFVNTFESIRILFTGYALKNEMIGESLVNVPFYEVYSRFFSDFITHFGWIVLLVVPAVIMVFFTRSKKDILLVSSFLVYILVFGLFGRYHERFGLVVYAPAALLMAKSIFWDLKQWSLRSRLWERIFSYAVVALLVLVSIYALSRTVVNIKNFNLLKTQSAWDRAVEYRTRHGLSEKRFSMARQPITPPLSHSQLLLNSIFKLKSQGRGAINSLNFVQANLSTYREFIESKENRDLDTLDFSRYNPFYTIQQRSFHSWSSGIVFLYHIPEALFQVPVEKRNISFPRVFNMTPSSGTSFLPLQVYEKNPNLGSLNGENRGHYYHWLYSEKKIQKIRVWLFSLSRECNISIKINGNEKKVKTKNRSPLEMIEINNIRPLVFYHDYVYMMEVKGPGFDPGTKPFYFVVEPVYTGKKYDSSPRFSMPAQEKIPRLFSGEPYPLWAVVFYKKTGIDLSLLEFINEAVIEIEPDSEEKEAGFIPLEKGDYIFRIEGERVGALPVNGIANGKYTVFGLNEVQEVQFPVVSPDPASNRLSASVSFAINEPLVFISFDLIALRNSNFKTGKVIITPDYRLFVQKKFIH